MHRTMLLAFCLTAFIVVAYYPETGQLREVASIIGRLAYLTRILAPVISELKMK